VNAFSLFSLKLQRANTITVEVKFQFTVTGMQTVTEISGIINAKSYKHDAQKNWITHSAQAPG